MASVPDKTGLWGFFKRYLSCSQKIAPTDGHSHCLFCLGETHNVETCIICLKFSKQARRNRAARLGVNLLEKSLKPQKLPMEPKAAQSSASALVVVLTAHSTQASHLAPKPSTPKTSPESTAQPAQRSQTPVPPPQAPIKLTLLLSQVTESTDKAAAKRSTHSKSDKHKRSKRPLLDVGPQTRNRRNLSGMWKQHSHRFWFFHN